MLEVLDTLGHEYAVGARMQAFLQRALTSAALPLTSTQCNRWLRAVPARGWLGLCQIAAGRLCPRIESGFGAVVQAWPDDRALPRVQLSPRPAVWLARRRST